MDNDTEKKKFMKWKSREAEYFMRKLEELERPLILDHFPVVRVNTLDSYTGDPVIVLMPDPPMESKPLDSEEGSTDDECSCESTDNWQRFWLLLLILQ